MATIQDLPIKDLSSMTDEELLECIKDVRARRRDKTSEAHQETVKKAKAKQKKGKATALQSVSSLVSSMSPTQAAELLSALRNSRSVKDVNKS